jgi:hypothetical protein
MGKSPAFRAVDTLSPIPPRICDANPERADLIDLDEQYVLMNTFRMSITPKAIQDLLDELESSKQSRLRALESLATASVGSFRGGERCDSGISPNDVQCQGRDPGTWFDQILPNSERGDE